MTLKLLKGNEAIAEAAIRAGQLGAQLHLSDLWIAKAATPEVREYIGYVLGMKPGPP